MSIEIIYRKAVFTAGNLADNFSVPIIEMGSNNCTEVTASGRERRARSWCLYSLRVGRENVTKWLKEVYNRYKDEIDCKLLQMNMQYRSSFRFPGKGNAQAAFSYLTRPNILPKMAERFIRINGLKPSELSRDFFQSKKWIENFSGVEEALYYSKFIRKGGTVTFMN